MCSLDSIAIPRRLFLEILAALRAYARLLSNFDQRANCNVTQLTEQLEQIYNRS